MERQTAKAIFLLKSVGMYFYGNSVSKYGHWTEPIDIPFISLYSLRTRH